MIVTKKMLLALTLVGALIGAGVGSLITRTSANNSPTTSYDTTQTANPDTNATYTQAAYRNDRTPEQIANDRSAQFSTTAEQTAFRQGFDEGFANCTGGVNNQRTTANYSTTDRVSTYRAPARRYSSSSRRVYYDYGTTRHGRTFWQKHRDKLTLAMGTGGGALIGGLIGGKKGAGIGSLVGLGSSALYTYKIRKRTRRY
jgi:hypothetical protein